MFVAIALVPTYLAAFQKCQVPPELEQAFANRFTEPWAVNGSLYFVCPRLEIQ